METADGERKATSASRRKRLGGSLPVPSTSMPRPGTRTTGPAGFPGSLPRPALSKSASGPSVTRASLLTSSREHIYRTHLNSLVCPRCGDKFNDDEAREAHLRADEMCKKKKLPPLDGVTKAQEKKLRARPKRGESEEEQWLSIYKIIFPDTPADSIPRSPCESRFETCVTSDDDYLLTHITEDCDDQEPQSLDGMHAFVRRELPRVVRLKLEEDIERIMNGAGTEMKDTIINLLPHLIKSLIEAYRGDMEQSDDETLAPVTSSVAGTNGQQPSEIVDGPYNEFEPYADIFNLDLTENFFENLDGDAGLASTSATMPFSF